MKRVILHSDLNNFYASVECLQQPSLRNKPVAVAGDREARHGIVLAKNEAAKRCGVKTGHPLWMAKQKCKDIIFIPPHYDKYMKFSKAVWEIYRQYTDQVESFGVDECWLDVSGSTALFGSGQDIANAIRRRIKQELGLTVSVGVSYNKIFAKLGSDLKKPDATTVIRQDNFKEIVWPLSVGELLYVGASTCNRLRRCGIETIGALAKTDPVFLESLLGKHGRTLWLFANGLDTSPVSNIGAKSMIKSISNSTTTNRDLLSDQDIRIVLYMLCESVSARMREYGFICKTVQVGIRDNSLHWIERQGALTIPNRTTASLFQKAYNLVKTNQTGRPIRSLSVRACDLQLPQTEQMSFLSDISAVQKQEQLEETVDNLRRRYGQSSLRRGIMLLDTSLSKFDLRQNPISIAGAIFTEEFS
ncbi:MAG: DNA polymerase IV [Clostridiales bacterium]|nr:DNA polymerase IV [Clostridiales bacterium]